MTARELSDRQTLLTDSGDLGVVVSVAGFADGAIQGLDTAGARIELVDLEGLLEIWLTHYQDLSDSDRALLPLLPVWFLADNPSSGTAAPAAIPSAARHPTNARKAHGSSVDPVVARPGSR